MDPSLPPSSPDVRPPEPPLGELLAEFRPPRARRLLVAACGLITLAAGASLVLVAPGPGRAWGLVLVAGGAFTLYVASLLARQRILLHTGGVVHILGSVRNGCPREDIARVVVSPPREPACPDSPSRLLRQDGSTLPLIDLTSAPFPGLLAALRPWAEARGIPWTQADTTPARGAGGRWLVYGVIALGTLVLLAVLLALWLAG